MTAVCTQLSFSGGTGSGAILEMVLRGDLERPPNFVVIRANPGMESGETNAYVDYMRPRVESAGIPFIEVRRNLLRGLLDLKASGATRFDLPPLWTRNRVTGKRGRLQQKCTKWAKIQPMDAAMRQWMHDNLGISRLSKRIGVGTVEKWIGFSADEWTRIKEDRSQKYVVFGYPLIDRKMKKPDVLQYFLSNRLRLPPRSVCNACYANDVEYFKKMHDERPDEFWNEAVAVDEACRDLSCVGVKDECFVSQTLLPLQELAMLGFVLPAGVSETVDSACMSGHCFV